MEKTQEPKTPLVSRSARPSFWQTLREVEEQVELPTLADTEGCLDPLYPEICRIITEVLMMDPGHEIKISGELFFTGMVQDIFKSLTAEHLQLVKDNFDKVTKEIKAKKSYLRTALYNSAFELEAHYANLVNRDLGY